jgi:hypothetical protein
MDAIYLLLIAGLFALSWGLVYVCDAIKGE